MKAFFIALFAALSLLAFAAAAHAGCPQFANNADDLARCIAANHGLTVGQVSGQMDQDHRQLMGSMRATVSVPAQVMPAGQLRNINPWLYTPGGYAMAMYNNPWLWASTYRYYWNH